MASKKPIRYQIVDGIRFPPKFLKSCLTDALNYKPRPDDTIISTYPKCGTTWMQMLVIQIFRNGEPLENPVDFMTTTPFLEMLGMEGVFRMPRPGLIKTHLPFNRMPYSSEAKYIFVIRNPLDTCVSLYHHTYMKPGFYYWDGSFDDFFQLFMDGEVEFNDYFDHLLSWYPHLTDQNVYWTTYETMKKDMKPVVLEVAKFLGDEYLKVVELDNSVMNKIIHHCGIDYMRDMYAKIEQARRSGPYKDMPKGLGHLCCAQEKDNQERDLSKVSPHIRKGLVGGWKDYFSEEQVLLMKEKFETKTLDTDIAKWWPDLFVQ